MSKICSENARELGRIGGKKSGEAKRRKKDMREALEIILDMPLKSGKVTDVEQIRNFAESKGKNLTVEQGILLVQVKKALNGDIASAQFIRDTSGQKPTDQVQVATIEVPMFEGEDELED